MSNDIISVHSVVLTCSSGLQFALLSGDELSPSGNSEGFFGYEYLDFPE